MPANPETKVPWPNEHELFVSIPEAREWNSIAWKIDGHVRAGPQSRDRPEKDKYPVALLANKLQNLDRRARAAFGDGQRVILQDDELTTISQGLDWIGTDDQSKNIRAWSAFGAGVAKWIPSDFNVAFANRANLQLETSHRVREAAALALLLHSDDAKVLFERVEFDLSKLSQQDGAKSREAIYLHAFAFLVSGNEEFLEWVFTNQAADLAALPSLNERQINNARAWLIALRIIGRIPAVIEQTLCKFSKNPNSPIAHYAWRALECASRMTDEIEAAIASAFESQDSEMQACARRTESILRKKNVELMHSEVNRRIINAVIPESLDSGSDSRANASEQLAEVKRQLAALDARQEKLHDEITAVAGKLGVVIQTLKEPPSRLPPADHEATVGTSTTQETTARSESGKAAEESELVLLAGLTTRQQRALKAILKLANSDLSAGQRIIDSLFDEPLSKAFAKSLDRTLRKKKWGFECPVCGAPSGISWTKRQTNIRHKGNQRKTESHASMTRLSVTVTADGKSKAHSPKLVRRPGPVKRP